MGMHDHPQFYPESDGRGQPKTTASLVDSRYRRNTRFYGWTIQLTLPAWICGKVGLMKSCRSFWHILIAIGKRKDRQPLEVAPSLVSNSARARNPQRCA
jgi:hypothetical protein